MEKKQRLSIRQLEAIVACNQSDGYLKQAARQKLQRIIRRQRILHPKIALNSM